MIAQTSHPAHIQSLTTLTEGFAYVLSRNGITGGKAEIPPHILDFILSLKNALSLPRFVGFGIHTPEQVSKLSEVCEGVIVGSALVRKFAEIDDLHLPEFERAQREEEIYSWIRGLRNSAL
jgi:tryptophan synthase alpha chain